ncbi:MAG: FAD-dependent oxidoreductase [Rhizobiales bacterium]|nr:FAD-dependent oxidoreductase [Hyphomicrobiales bacterium]
MRIAVVGSGIAGLGAAYRLSRHFGAESITLFEKDTRLGGHAATVDIDYDGKPVAVDTGFIVFNTLNYPLLTALFAELGVATHRSNMGFSLSLDGGRFEWSGQETNVVSSFFAQPLNLIRPRLWRMLRDMRRFSSEAVEDRESGRLAGLSLGDYLAAKNYGRELVEDYVLPMGAAIWSMSARAVLDFPAESFIAFFDNHRLLHWNRPAWRTVAGGSRAYVSKLVNAAGFHVHSGDGAASVKRLAQGVEVITTKGHRGHFDAVVLATHSDQALALLAHPSAEERRVLGHVRYSENEVILHRDARLMPKRKRAWAAWNVIGASDEGAGERPVMVSYWMNRLQGIDESRPLFVTLNPRKAPVPESVFGRFSYAHPQYDAAALAAQRALPELQGRGGIYFAGAWTGYGFHEDGLRAGYHAADQLIAAHGLTGAPSVPMLAVGAPPRV